MASKLLCSNEPLPASQHDYLNIVSYDMFYMHSSNTQNMKNQNQTELLSFCEWGELESRVSIDGS